MIKKSRNIIFSILLLLMISSCSASASVNKANLEEAVFEKSTKLVQYIYKEMNGESVPEDEYKELLSWYSDKFESENYSSEDEELLFSQLELIKAKQGLYAIQQVNEELFGEYSDSYSNRDEIEEIFKEIEDNFGISYKN